MLIDLTGSSTRRPDSKLADGRHRFHIRRIRHVALRAVYDVTSRIGEGRFAVVWAGKSRGGG